MDINTKPATTQGISTMDEELLRLLRDDEWKRMKSLTRVDLEGWHCLCMEAADVIEDQQTSINALQQKIKDQEKEITKLDQHYKALDCTCSVLANKLNTMLEVVWNQSKILANNINTQDSEKVEDNQ